MIGSSFGPYQIVAKIGEGGMGEVYRAHDASTGRDVALKILPELAAADPERLARFQREAKALGGLNHPNIAAIYGVEDRGPVPAIIMELVAGEDLSDRINRGAVPVAEALAIARQIADALSTAHDAGIVHRDLKPHNVKLREDGVVKVLDFGLAKTTDAAVTSGMATNSPTLTARATAMGMILGTAAYMSPEQAKGKSVDKRADIWAFGVVFYEMLTGRRAFPGDDVSDVLASVLKSDPDLQALPADTPVAVRRLIARCLTKDPRQRLRDLGEGIRQLDDADVAPAPAATSTAPEPFWRRAMPVALAVIITAAIAFAAYRFMQPAPAAPESPVRFAVTPTAGFNIAATVAYNDLAWLPDESGFVYTVFTQAQPFLIVRKFDQFDSAPLRGATAAIGPFVSPDGKWIGFTDATNPARLKKVEATGGAPVPLTLFPRTVYGATFTNDGASIIAGSGSDGLSIINANGGEPAVLTTIDTTTGETSHRWPSAVPGTSVILFVGFGAGTAHLCAFDLATKRVARLGVQGSMPRFVAPSYLVFAVREGGLRAVSFDAARMEVSGTPAPVLEGVTTKSSGAVIYDVTPGGQLVYGAGTGLLANRTIVWVDRIGKETPTNAPPRTYYYARIAPVGGKISLDVREQDGDIWIWDPRGTNRLLTQTEGTHQYGLWTPDGERVIFQSSMKQKEGIYVMRADGLGEPALITEGANGFPNAITQDGVLIFRQASSATKNDLFAVSIDGPDRVVKPLIQTPHDELNASMSPDGKWIAFESDASGKFEVYVRPYPDVNAFQEVVSTAGATEPVWGGNREIIFVAADQELKSVTMTVGANGKPTFTAPVKIFETSAYYFGGLGRNYDISSDGKRFVMVKRGADAPSGNEPLRVVLNWFEEVKKTVGRK